MANIFDVAKYFLSSVNMEESGEGITNLKMQKLCYYAQGFFLALYGKRLFHNNIEAWMYGPVVPDLYEKTKTYEKNPIPLDAFLQDFPKLEKNEKDILDEIFQVYGQFSAWKLADMTHKESPWLDYKDAEDKIIPDKALTEFFKTKLK